MPTPPKSHALYSPPSRHVTTGTRLRLYGEAAGSCAICRRNLLSHIRLRTRGNFGEMAHINAFSPDGPRGTQDRRRAYDNNPENLILLCKDCHRVVDKERPQDFPVRRLRDLKAQHARRIRHFVDADPGHAVHAIALLAPVAGEETSINANHIADAIAPRYLAGEPLLLDYNGQGVAERAAFYELVRDDMRRKVRDYLRPAIDSPAPKRLAVFGLAPIPLLVLLGTTLSDKVPATLYPRHHDGGEWRWLTRGRPASFSIAARGERPSRPTGIGLVLSVSGEVPARTLPGEAESLVLYELRPREPLVPRRGLLRTRADLEAFRVVYRSFLDDLTRMHPSLRQMWLFPALPPPAAIACGLEWNRKVSPQLVVCELDRRTRQFGEALRTPDDDEPR